LSTLLDAEEGTPSWVAAHLGACLSCARRFERLRQVRQALRGLERPTVPAAVGSRLRNTLAASPRRPLANWPDLLQPRRLLAPLCAALMVAVSAVTYLESEARARASTTARETVERLLAANRFESMLDGPSPASDRLVGRIWLEPGLAQNAARPIRRLAGSSREAQDLLAAFADVRRAFELPGVEAVRLRAAGGTVEIARPLG
jgi:anti-sigma factor RsiW